MEKRLANCPGSGGSSDSCTVTFKELFSLFFFLNSAVVCPKTIPPGGATLLLFHLPIRSSALQQGLNPAKCELKEQNKIFIGSVPDLFLHSETQTRGSNELGLLSVRSAEPSAFNQTLAPNEIFPRMNDTRPS